jgi:hypothetical protein
MKTPETDREKALAILLLATGTAPAQLAAQLAGDTFTEVEIAALAHAYDQDRSTGFAHEVLNFSETRKVMEKIAADRAPAAPLVPEPDADEDTVLDETKTPDEGTKPVEDETIA